VPLSLLTLMLVAVFIFTLMSILTLHAWRRCAGDPSLGYLGAMLLASTLGVGLTGLRGLGMDYLALVLGNSLLLPLPAWLDGHARARWAHAALAAAAGGAAWWWLFSLWPGLP
jgi:hypothetical protein